MSYFPSRTVLLLPLVSISVAAATMAPVDLSWRSLGMGGAGVAIADDGDALHENPAGLTQIAWPGAGFAPLDSLGYKRDQMETWALGAFDPGPENLLQIWRFWNHYRGTIDSGTSNPTVLLENQQMLDDLYQFNFKPLPVDGALDGGFALHDIGADFWSRDAVTLEMDHGAVTPKAIMKLTTTSAIEGGTARSFIDDRLSLGVGYRIVAVSSAEREYDLVKLRSAVSSAPVRLLLNTGSELRNTDDWGYGLDLGFLWFQTPGLRFAGSIQDLGMKLDQRFVVPDLTIGTAWAPKIFQNNGLWARKINFGVSMENMLYDTLGYKPLSKLDFGAEWMQTVIPYVLTGRISAGFKGGYPTFLISGTVFKVFRGELLTYGEETGYFTGDRENRVLMVRLGVSL